MCDQTAVLDQVLLNNRLRKVPLPKGSLLSALAAALHPGEEDESAVRESLFSHLERLVGERRLPERLKCMYDKEFRSNVLQMCECRAVEKYVLMLTSLAFSRRVVMCMATDDQALLTNIFNFGFKDELWLCRTSSGAVFPVVGCPDADKEQECAALVVPPYMVGYQLVALKEEDDSKRVFTGRLKFFDECKNYGFIIMDEDSSDIFVHYDDLEKAKISREQLRSAKLGQIIRFQFSCMKYFGKYKESRKAVNLTLLEAPPGPFSYPLVLP